MKKISFILIIFLLGCATVPETPYYDPEQVDIGVYRGQRPVPQNLFILKERGINVILDLESNEDAIEAERKAAEAIGIKFYSIPMSGISRPDKADLIKAVDIIQSEKKNNIYVHCLHGQDRTGFVIAAYRMLIGKWSLDAAYGEAALRGHRWTLYSFWKESLEELEEK